MTGAHNKIYIYKHEASIMCLYVEKILKDYSKLVTCREYDNGKEYITVVTEQGHVVIFDIGQNSVKNVKDNKDIFISGPSFKEELLDACKCKKS